MLKKLNWQTKKLGEVLKLEYGKPLSDDKRNSKGKYPVYGANGEKDRTNEYYHDKPSIIVGRKGSAGEVNFTESKFWPLDVTYFVTFDDEKYDLKYLYNVLCALELPKLARGVKPGINRNEVYSIEVKIPPLPEQQRLVKILDRAFAAIEKAKENAEKNLQNAKEVFEAYLQNVFANPGDGWEEKMLGEVGKTQTGTTPKTSDKENYGNYIPFVTPADINIVGDGSVRYADDGLSEQGLENGRKMDKNSILMVCIGASIGKVGFVDREVSCNQQINSLTVKKGLCPKFFYYALSTRNFFEQVIKNSAQATLPIINKGKWEKLSISYPVAKKEQEAIVAQLDSLSAQTKKLEAIYQKKLKDLEELKKSLLQKAFSGEL